MTDIEQWKQIAMILHESLPALDRVLSEGNFPIADRPNKAFELIQSHMLSVSDYEKFMVSDAHGRMRVIVSDWYERRYGRAATDAAHREFIAVVTLHGTPFRFRVPKTFRTRSDKPNQIWVGFPASVQVEEEPLSWIDGQEVVKRLSGSEKAEAQKKSKSIGDLIRSVQHDLGSLIYDQDRFIADLSEQIAADLQASAQHLCAGTNAGLRTALWDVSQATEKALKLFVRHRGRTPPHSHDLGKLAELAEKLGATSIARTKLALIPANRSATSLRYGGQVQLQDAVEAYDAALQIIQDLLFQINSKNKYNMREARFLIQKPPWFEFDSESFLTDLHDAMKSNDTDSSS